MLTTNNHPLFELNMRRRRWWQNGLTPSRYALEVIAWVVMVLLLAWVLLVGVRYGLLVRDVVNGGRWSMYRLTDTVWIVLLWSAGISVGLSYLLDFVLMAVTVGSISGEQQAHRWQLIQLTPLSGQSVVTALHHANQFRLWRVTMVIIGTRIAVTLAALLTGFVLQPILERMDWRDAWDSFWYYPVQNVYLGLMLVMLALFFIIEPLWRLRATTALAMAVSAQVERYVAALALAFPLMVSVWLLMIGIAGGMFWGTTRLFDLIYDYLDYDVSEYIGVIVALGFVVIEIAFFYYGFRLIERGALAWTLRRAFTLREHWQPPDDVRPWWSGLRWWLPHSGIWRENPLFNVNLGRVRWWQDERSPRRRLLRLGLWVVAVLVGLYGLALLARTTFDPHGSMLEGGLVVMGGAVLVLLMWQDLRITQATMNGVVRARVPPDNELLRLTALRPADIVEAYRAVVRVRVWNMTAVMAVHVAVVAVLYIVHQFAVPLPSAFNRGGAEDVPLGVMALLIVPPFVVMRARVITALMLALALRLRGTLLHVAWALLLIGLLVAQVLVILVLVGSGYLQPGEMLALMLLVTLVLAAAEWVALWLARRFV